MYPIDPTLYGATLPQREIPFPIPPQFVSPFYGQNMPFQGLPWQNMPIQGFGPWQNLPKQGAPWQNFQMFTPPVIPQGVPPYIPQAFAYPPIAPFSPTAFNPYAQTGVPSSPFCSWQRPHLF